MWSWLRDEEPAGSSGAAIGVGLLITKTDHVGRGPAGSLGGRGDRRGGPLAHGEPPASRRQLLLGEEHVGVGAPVREQEIGHRITVVTPGEVLV